MKPTPLSNRVLHSCAPTVLPVVVSQAINLILPSPFCVNDANPIYQPRKSFLILKLFRKFSRQTSNTDIGYVANNKMSLEFIQWPLFIFKWLTTLISHEYTIRVNLKFIRPSINSINLRACSYLLSTAWAVDKALFIQWHDVIWWKVTKIRVTDALELAREWRCARCVKRAPSSNNIVSTVL